MAETIILLGDDGHRRQYICRALMECGFSVQICESYTVVEQVILQSPAAIFVVLIPTKNFMMQMLLKMQEDEYISSQKSNKIIISETSVDNNYARNRGVRADEYLIEPLKIADLVNVIQQFATKNVNNHNKNHLSFGDLRLDLTSKSMTLRKLQLSFDPVQIRLLQCLMLQPNRAFSRAEIALFVWGPDISVEDQTVDVYIGRIRSVLRHKVAVDPIRTIQRFGYGLNHEFTKSDSTPKKVRRSKKLT